MGSILFLLELCVCFYDCRGCVGTATIIDFGKQVRIVCLHGRGMYRNWKRDRSCPSLGCSARPFAKANCPHRTPLKSAFFDSREYDWQNQSGANNGILFVSSPSLHDRFESAMVRMNTPHRMVRVDR